MKKGKSCSTDLILNEMFEHLTPLASSALLKVFNHCLSSGKYPWHTSVITPIFKSGNPFDPENYRAIAVGSCMGKLFSSILLDRLILFKELYCPDPKEQLEFQKRAQTNDHILTLKTLIDKYTKKHKTRLYTCFVDLRKAFDTVSRYLLLHKIANLGISGEFFNVLHDMYNNSIAKIKIAQLLSPDIKVLRGTEQGHPLSPDLFKIFIQELSSLLIGTSLYPSLSDVIISHLLWADDLVLLALDPKSLQDNISILSDFCKRMGLEINIKKTKIVTFCPPNKKPLYECFTIGDAEIKYTEKYCYLGIMFHQNGSFTTANSELRAKALRALFGLKGKIIKDSLSFKSINTLFDALVKPILLYGCQVLAPHLRTMKYLADTSENTKACHFLQHLAKDHYEQFHLKYLKWNLSVHPKASNSGCWGDSGRYPLFLEACKLAIDYFERVKECNNNSDGSLLAAAFREQKSLGLDWYINTQRLMTRFSYPVDDAQSSCRPSRPSILISQNLKSTFIDHWRFDITNSPKLEFYCQHKSEFTTEPYLSHIDNPKHRSSVTRLRISAHDLYIERGRYERPLVPRESRWCAFCYMHYNSKCIEDEMHALTTCPLTYPIKKCILGSANPFSHKIDELTTSTDGSAKCHNLLVGRLTHAILEAYKAHTTYYKTQEYHNATGKCVLL